jgi:putative ABC transport system permease protein
VLDLPVTAIAQSLLGAPAYMDMSALNRALGEGPRVSGAYLRIDPDRQAEVHRRLKEMSSVAGVSLKSDAMVAFETIMNSGAGSVRYVMGLIAFVITFGIVYNAARVAQAERARDLASLRVIGFHTGETAFVLLGELAVVVLVALPLGSVLGQALSSAVAEGFSTELYQIPALFLPSSHGYAALIVLAAALTSGWIVKRDIDRADLISALKMRD